MQGRAEHPPCCGAGATGPAPHKQGSVDCGGVWGCATVGECRPVRGLGAQEPGVGVDPGEIQSSASWGHPVVCGGWGVCPSCLL